MKIQSMLKLCMPVKEHFAGFFILLSFLLFLLTYLLCLFIQNNKTNVFEFCKT